MPESPNLSRRQAIRYLVTGSLGLAALPCGCKTEVAAVPSTSDLEGGHGAAQAWQVRTPAKNHEIEGYASRTSVNRGETLELFVSTSAHTYTIEIFRLGWYDGKGAQLMIPAVHRRGKLQRIPEPEPETGLIECQWSDPYLLQVPISSDPSIWPSGVYLAKLTASKPAAESYIHFVVRDDDRPSDLLFQTSVATYQAYNKWGGLSLYDKPHASMVSFNRPYKRGYGSGDFLFWEYSLVRFLEREGYVVTYTTDVDTHERGHLLTKHKAFLSVGHDEYWSWEMRDNVEAALAQGVHLGFFGANIGYWQVRFEPSLATGALNRTMVCYKSQAEQKDPFFHDPDPAKRRRTTTQFRRHPVNRPEAAIIGVMYESHQAQGDIVISDSSSWVFDGTGLAAGDVLPGLLGYEVDRKFPESPSGTHVFAHSPYFVNDSKRIGEMAYYTASSSATVVATGSMQWNWGLDETFRIHGRKFVSPAAKQMTRNFLARFGAQAAQRTLAAVQSAVLSEDESAFDPGSPDDAPDEVADDDSRT